MYIVLSIISLFADTYSIRQAIDSKNINTQKNPNNIISTILSYDFSSAQKILSITSTYINGIGSLSLYFLIFLSCKIQHV